jgi:hypothetical protein
MHWCELVERKVIDCGAHAALAQEAFGARGVTAFRAQFVQRYCPLALEQWRTRWRADQIGDQWIGEDVIYHEGNAVETSPGEVRLWDASAGWWLNPRNSRGYGSLAAVRIFTEEGVSSGVEMRWGEHRLKANEWNAIGG